MDLIHIKSRLGAAEWLLVVICLLLLLSQFLFPIQDGDYYWHLRSGQYLVAHKALPDHDPFSFTTPEIIENKRVSLRSEVILTQYWLGQVVLYGIYQLTGEAGVVLLRAGAFGLLLFGLYIYGRRFNYLSSLAMLLVSGCLLTYFPTERPQIFTFIFMPMLLVMLEMIRCRSERSILAAWLLPLLMFLWANMHGGFLLGSGLCLIYLAGHFFAVIRRQSAFQRTTIASLLFALLAAAVNPNGYNVLLVWLNADPVYIKSIYENLSPFYVWQFGHYYPAFWICLVVTLLSVVFGWRKFSLEQLLVLLSLSVLAMTSLRYMVFLGLALLIILPRQKEIPAVLLWVTVLAGAVLMITGARIPTLPDGADTKRFPVAGIESLQSTGVSEVRIFSLYDWGGYTGFLLPQSKVFIDGRGLVADVDRLYEQVMAGNRWQQILDNYTVDLIIIPGVDWYSGLPANIVRELQISPAWSLVFWDDVSLVFIRKDSNLSVKFSAIDKQSIYQHQVVRSRWLESRDEVNKENLLQTRVTAQVRLGELKAAMASCENLLELNPKNQFAKDTLQFLRYRLGH